MTDTIVLDRFVCSEVWYEHRCGQALPCAGGMVESSVWWGAILICVETKERHEPRLLTQIAGRDGFKRPAPRQIPLDPNCEQQTVQQVSVDCAAGRMSHYEVP